MSSPTGSIQKLADIKSKIFDGMYDHMTEKGCSRVTAEVMLDINALIQAARVDELERYQAEMTAIRSRMAEEFGRTEAPNTIYDQVLETRIKELNNIGGNPEATENKN